MSARRVLLVTNDLGPRAGGIETFILGLLSQLDGSDCVIYTSAQEGSEAFDKKLNQDYGVVVVRDRGKVLLPTPRVNRSVLRVMKENGSEIIWFGAAMPLGWMSGYLKIFLLQNILLYLKFLLMKVKDYGLYIQNI